MAAARFVVAALKFGPCTIEEQRGHLQVGPLRKLLDHGDGVRGIEPPGARIEADRHGRARIDPRRAVLGFEQAVEQADGEVVDRFPAHVLQGAQCGGLARTEQAGDEENALGRRLMRHGRLALRLPGGLEKSGWRLVPYQEIVNP